MKNNNLSLYKIEKILFSCFILAFAGLVFQACGEDLKLPDYSLLPPPNINGGNQDEGETPGVKNDAIIMTIVGEGSELWRGDKFKIKLSHLKQTTKATLPLTFKIFLKDDNGALITPTDLFEGFVDELLVTGNEAETPEIKVKESIAPTNINFVFVAQQKSDVVLLEDKYRVAVGASKQENNVANEQYIYPRPDKEFHSSVYANLTGFAENIQSGDPHPNQQLAKEGWKFYTSHEFHRVNALTNVAYPQYPQARGFEKYKNYFMEKNSTFTKESTTRVTANGHLELWAKRNEHNKVEEEDFLYFPMGRPDFLAGTPNPDLYNNWEVGGIISDAPHKRSHWADFRPGMRIEIRMRLENQREIDNPGNAIWFMPNRYYVYDGQNGGLWPFLNWPNCGEIDFLETTNPRLNIAYSTLHSRESGGWHYSTGSNTGNGGLDYTVYNIYWMEWTESGLKFGINGKTHTVIDGTKLTNGTFSTEQLWAPFTDKEIEGTAQDWLTGWFHNPHGFRIILNLDMQAGAWCSGWPGPVDGGPVPAWANETDPNKLPKMDVDWIRCYYDQSKGFKGVLPLCPGGALPDHGVEGAERPYIVNY